ncbi:MAG: PKD domain-containing protein [Dehalococcoidia bacterium]|nr:PKD domain-containing protein [Dehalococcoidia bacterium]
MGAMWYYFARPDGSDKSLYGRYDNNGEPNPPTPSLWHDDANVIKFCSMLQKDYDDSPPKIEVWNPATGSKDPRRAENYTESWEIAGGDNFTRHLFEAAMLGSHEPQMVGLTRKGGGHAMVCYRIVDGTLKIYDPNYPGGVGEVVWKDGKYQPYKGGEQAGVTGRIYPLITWLPKAALVSDWGKIQGWWNDAQNGTLGNGLFPAYKVSVVDDKGDKDELKDGYETTDGSIKLEFDNPQLKYELYTADPLTMSSLTELTAAADGKYYLKGQGETMLGIYVADQQGEWVDFKWYKVKSGAADPELKIEAPGTQGYTDEPCTFKALTKNVPKDASLEWYFYGNAEEQGKKYKDTDSVTHTFDTSGDKTITCQIIRGKEVKPLAKESVTYKVVQPPLDIIASPPKGAVKQTCTFQLARSNPIPYKDAKFEWSFGNGKSGQGEEVSTIYDEAKTYTVSVTATWVKKVGNTPIQEHTYGELKYEVVDALPLKIVADPGTGIVGEKTSFSVEGENIPGDVAFYWEFGDKDNEGNISSIQKDGAAAHTYTKENTYSVRVSMLDKKNPKPLAQATLRYNVEPPVTLAIAAPKEIVEGNGVANKDYVFKSSWEPGKAPDGVKYTWWFHAGAETYNAEKITSFVVGSFTLNLKANWKDQRGVEREAKATPLAFEIKSAAAFAIITTDKGLQNTANGLIGTKYTFLADWNPQKAPAGVSYTWTVDGVGVEDQGGKILHTFTTEGEHAVFAKAAWKDDKGNAQTGNNNLVVFMSLPKESISLTCTDADIQNSQTGVTKKDYTFNVSWASGKAPAGVKYRWFIDGNETGKTGVTEVFKFVDENTYRLNVQADWDTPAGKHEWSLGQMIFKIETPTNFSVRCADSGLQSSRKGVPDKDYRFYTYWGEGGSAPDGASYTWFLNDEESGDTGEDAHFTLSADPSEASKSYTVKATAKWTDPSGNEKSTNSSFKFDIGSAPTLSIKVPDEIKSGKGVINKQYSFSVTANNIPAGAEYTWYSGDEAKKQGKDLKSVTNTFAAATDYVLKVEAKWTDAGGKTQSVTSPEVAFHISGAVTITLNAPADIKANKGVKGQKYQFSVTAVNIPPGAEYAWYSNDQEKIRGKDSKSGSISFSEAIDYTMRVEANWTDSSGQSQSVSSPEVSFRINDVFIVTLTAPAEIKAGKGIKGQKYSFSVTTENIPAGAEYVWYSNGQEKTSGKDLKTGNISFTEAIDYTMKVEARWTDTNGKSLSASSPAVSFHIGAAASLSIIPPGDLPGGKGVPEKSYTFSAKPQGVPDNAEYTWYVNDKSLGKSSKDKSPVVKTEKEPRDYTVKAVASWKVNNQPQQAEGTYKFTTNTGVVLTSGQFIEGAGTCTPSQLNQIGTMFLQPVVSQVIINIVADKATTDQTVPFTINYNGGSADGSAKVKVNCSYTGGKLNGTFNIDGVINYKDADGKAIPVDIGYAGNMTSTAIPATPKGESVTCTLTGSIKSQMLYQIILSAGAAAAACAASLGGSSSGGGGETQQMPTSEVICTGFISKVQFTATAASGK